MVTNTTTELDESIVKLNTLIGDADRGEMQYSVEGNVKGRRYSDVAPPLQSRVREHANYRLQYNIHLTISSIAMHFVVLFFLLSVKHGKMLLSVCLFVCFCICGHWSTWRTNLS